MRPAGGYVKAATALKKSHPEAPSVGVDVRFRPRSGSTRVNRAPSAQGREADIAVLAIELHFQAYGNGLRLLKESGPLPGTPLSGPRNSP